MQAAPENDLREEEDCKIITAPFFTGTRILYVHGYSPAVTGIEIQYDVEKSILLLVSMMPGQGVKSTTKQRVASDEMLFSL